MRICHCRTLQEAEASRRAGASTEPPKIRGKLYEALRKDAKHLRVVFIELNRTQTIENGVPDWATQIDEEMATLERELTIDGKPAPSAYVFVTNRAFMQALDSKDCGEAGLACGFKTGDFASRRGFPSILEAVKARDRHIELHWLLKAIEA